jgi:hypothetical protein
MNFYSQTFVVYPLSFREVLKGWKTVGRAGGQAELLFYNRFIVIYLYGRGEIKYEHRFALQCGEHLPPQKTSISNQWALCAGRFLPY